jgi:hypothetical protein
MDRKERYRRIFLNCPDIYPYFDKFAVLPDQIKLDWGIDDDGGEDTPTTYGR